MAVEDSNAAVQPQVPKKFNAFETPGPGRYNGTLNRTGDASFTKHTSSPSFGFGSGTYADGPKRCALCVPLRPDSRLANRCVPVESGSNAIIHPHTIRVPSSTRNATYRRRSPP
jgi:hypothetical protein